MVYILIRFFFHLLDLSTMNRYALFKLKHRKNISFRSIHIELIRQFIESFIQSKRSIAHSVIGDNHLHVRLTASDSAMNFYPIGLSESNTLLELILKVISHASKSFQNGLSLFSGALSSCLTPSLLTARHFLFLFRATAVTKTAGRYCLIFGPTSRRERKCTDQGSGWAGPYVFGEKTMG